MTSGRCSTVPRALLLAHAFLGWALLLGPAMPAVAQGSESACGPLHNAYGPFDYRSEHARLDVVERFHFSPTVESLISGQSGSLGGDLDYTLRASPNHHRALLSLTRWGTRSRSQQPPTLPRPIECYFERALRFQPDDTVARMLYARFLAAQRREPEAAQQLARVTELAGENALTHYNAGLLYAELKAYDKALVQAHEALRFGYTATGLREQLQAAGQWREPVSAQASDPDGKRSDPRP